MRTNANSSMVTDFRFPRVVRPNNTHRFPTAAFDSVAFTPVLHVSKYILSSMLLSDITIFECVYVESARKWVKCTCCHSVQAIVAAMQAVDGSTRAEAESRFVNRCWGRPDFIVIVCFGIPFTRTMHVSFHLIACITFPLSYADCSSFVFIAVLSVCSTVLCLAVLCISCWPVSLCQTVLDRSADLKERL